MAGSVAKQRAVKDVIAKYYLMIDVSLNPEV